MKLSRNQITGLCVVLLGIFTFVMISRFSVPFTAAYPGPKALPGLAGIGFIICGAGIFLEGCKEKDAKPFMTKDGYKKLCGNVLILAAYILGMKYLGYVIATPIVLYVLCTWYAKGYVSTVKGRVIFSVATTAIIYLAYAVAFGYSLPMGLFG